jgi:hypothetical protein
MIRQFSKLMVLANRNLLKWKLKLTAELAPGECIEYDVAAWERAEEVTLGSLGLSLAEGKAILAAMETQMVIAQIERQGQTRCCCGGAGGTCRTRAATDPRFGPCMAMCRCRSGVWKLVEAAARIPQLRCLRGSPPPLQSSDT